MLRLRLGLAVEVGVTIGTVVAVALLVISGNNPFPHPELGNSAMVYASIVKMGSRRAAVAILPRPGGGPPSWRLMGEIGGLIFGPS
jgi:hypothetical protein